MGNVAIWMLWVVESIFEPIRAGNLLIYFLLSFKNDECFQDMFNELSHKKKKSHPPNNINKYHSIKLVTSVIIPIGSMYVIFTYIYHKNQLFM